MDTVSLESLLGAMPQAGVGAIVLWLLVLMMRRESAAQARFTEDTQQLRDEIVRLRAQINDLQAQLDREREERRRAEDKAAAAMRRYTAYEVEN